MKLKYPVKNPQIEQGFGIDSKGTEYEGFYDVFGGIHPGVDFEVPEGTKVYSAYSGVVVRSEFHKGMGNVVGLRHGNILILYAHLSQIKVKIGDIVKQGSLVGLSGNTGDATTSPHLHFEMRNLAKDELKDMIFEPKFNQPLDNLTQELVYTVNNTNSQKTLLTLSEKFFGSQDYWKKIAKLNNLNQSKDEVLPQGNQIIIPNF